MKKTQFITRVFFLMLCTAMLVLSACKKEKQGCTDPLATNYDSSADKNNGTCVYPPGEPTFGFYAKVDGVEFVDQDIMAIESADSLGIIALGDTVSFYPVIGVVFPLDIAPGIYTFEGPSGNIRGAYNLGNLPDELYSAAAGTGELKIISHDTLAKIVSAQFNFIAVPNPGNTNTNSFEISEGSFTVDYN